MTQLEAMERSSWPGVVSAIARDIKLSHTVFALPFALLGMALAAEARGSGLGLDEVGLILFCMVTARTSAMAMNRFSDAAIDARNPRTAERAVPAGRVSRRAMGLAVVVSGGLFVLGAWGFWLARGNVWPGVLSPVVLGWLLGYGYTKRWTWLCHVYLGVALALSPLAAGLAIWPGYLGGAALWLLAGMVACWVAGFDVIYALQDVAADRAEGLYSMPSRLGVGRALWVSRGLHAVCVVLLVGFAITAGMGVLFSAAVVLAAGLLALEHGLIARSTEKHLHMAFFTVNGVISLLLGAAGMLDLWLV